MECNGGRCYFLPPRRDSGGPATDGGGETMDAGGDAMMTDASSNEPMMTGGIQCAVSRSGTTRPRERSGALWLGAAALAVGLARRRMRATIVK
ncbi:MAG: hypothetical protein Q8Q09_07055 [Deltaproteobacteria bacterium]|nr:hypothetical protein [Deltaproteobacteria bacterium]